MAGVVSRTVTSPSRNNGATNSRWRPAGSWAPTVAPTAMATSHMTHKARAPPREWGGGGRSPRCLEAAHPGGKARVDKRVGGERPPPGGRAPPLGGHRPRVDDQ